MIIGNVMGIPFSRGAKKAKIYGFLWNKSSSPVLTRTNDSINMVANIGIDSQIVQNDFDNAEIYKDIHDAIDSSGNVFRRIPKFYIKKVDTPVYKSTQISLEPFDGCYLPWIFWDFTNNKELPYYDHGKHKATLGAGNKLESKPGSMPLVNRHIVDFRTFAQNNNVEGLKGYQQLDIHAVDVLQTLFYVEFATLNSQAIMLGLTDASNTQAWVNGFSSDIVASSGCITANDGKTPCMYRGIESPWGDIYQFVDGININNNQAWVAKNAEDYASNVFAEPYEKLSYINGNANGYTTTMGHDSNNPFAELPVAVGGGASTHYSDYYYQNTGQRIARVGGRWSNGASAGVSFWYLNTSSAAVFSDIGGRLLKKAS